MTVSNADETGVPTGGGVSRARAGGTAQAHIQIPIPLPEGMGTLSIPRHVSGASIDLVQAIIDSYKPLLTATPQNADEQ